MTPQQQVELDAIIEGDQRAATYINRPEKETEGVPLIQWWETTTNPLLLLDLALRRASVDTLLDFFVELFAWGCEETDADPDSAHGRLVEHLLVAHRTKDDQLFKAVHNAVIVWAEEHFAHRRRRLSNLRFIVRLCWMQNIDQLTVRYLRIHLATRMERIMQEVLSHRCKCATRGEPDTVLHRHEIRGEVSDLFRSYITLADIARGRETAA